VEPEFVLGVAVAVENFGREIETVGLHEGAAVRVDTKLGEVVRDVKRLEGSCGFAGRTGCLGQPRRRRAAA
jgi:hypothetical protein